MEQSPSYVRISELIKMAKHDAAPRQSKCNQTLALIEQTFRSIDDMSIDEREEVMKRVIGWMIVEKFEGKGHTALLGIQRYCIADCLDDDPSWIPPQVAEPLKSPVDTN